MDNFAGEKKKSKRIMDLNAELENVPYLSYNNKDIVLVDDISDVPQSDASLVDFVMIILCTHGKIQFRQNGQLVTISENQLHICQPGTVLTDYMISVGMKCRVLSFSQKNMAK